MLTMLAFDASSRQHDRFSRELLYLSIYLYASTELINAFFTSSSFALFCQFLWCTVVENTRSQNETLCWDCHAYLIKCLVRHHTFCNSDLSLCLTSSLAVLSSRQWWSHYVSWLFSKCLTTIIMFYRRTKKERNLQVEWLLDLYNSWRINWKNNAEHMCISQKSWKRVICMTRSEQWNRFLK